MRRVEAKFTSPLPLISVSVRSPPQFSFSPPQWLKPTFTSFHFTSSVNFFPPLNSRDRLSIIETNERESITKLEEWTHKRITNGAKNKREKNMFIEWQCPMLALVNSDGKSVPPMPHGQGAHYAEQKPCWTARKKPRRRSIRMNQPRGMRINQTKGVRSNEAEGECESMKRQKQGKLRGSPWRVKPVLVLAQWLNGRTDVFLCIGCEGGWNSEKLRDDQFARTIALQRTLFLWPFRMSCKAAGSFRERRDKRVDIRIMDFISVQIRSCPQQHP
jgi:hypothetical protein